MAYCRKCGSEVLEEAAVCTKCGALTKAAAKQINSPAHKNFSNTFSFWLLFIAGVVFALNFFNLGGLYIHGVASTFISIFIFALCVLSYALSFAELKKRVLSELTNRILLFFVVVSFIYALTNYITMG